jgi:phosphate transport system substrate-binding protein
MMRKNVKRASILLYVLAACAMLTAASVQAADRETILRLHGSNTVGARLAPDLAAAFLKELGAESVKQVHVLSDTETDVEGYFPDKGQTKVIEIRAHGSSTAFKDMKDGKCDIGMASRKIKASEAKELAALGDMTGPASEHVLALDGVAVIVNPANTSVWKMDSALLADVFSGRIRDWAKIGGASAPITIHARDEKSGTHDTFQSLVLGGQKLADSAVRHESNEELSAAVAADVNAIGYCGLPHVQGNKTIALADGGRAVPPTVFTVAGEEYPVSRRLHLYTPAVPHNPYIQDFIAFALGQEGQRQVEQCKFVGLAIAPRTAKAKEEGEKKLSVCFRFKGDSLELDSRGLRDLDRIVDFLAEQKRISAELILTGYSDSTAGYAKSLDLSCKRTEVVKEELVSRGIKVADVRCLGQDAPICSSKTENGRERNSRVEVWMR